MADDLIGVTDAQEFCTRKFCKFLVSKTLCKHVSYREKTCTTFIDGASQKGSRPMKPCSFGHMHYDS